MNFKNTLSCLLLIFSLWACRTPSPTRGNDSPINWLETLIPGYQNDEDFSAFLRHLTDSAKAGKDLLTAPSHGDQVDGDKIFENQVYETAAAHYMKKIIHQGQQATDIGPKNAGHAANVLNGLFFSGPVVPSLKAPRGRNHRNFEAYAYPSRWNSNYSSWAQIPVPGVDGTLAFPINLIKLQGRVFGQLPQPIRNPSMTTGPHYFTAVQKYNVGAIINMKGPRDHPQHRLDQDLRYFGAQRKVSPLGSEFKEIFKKTVMEASGGTCDLKLNHRAYEMSFLLRGATEEDQEVETRAIEYIEAQDFDDYNWSNVDPTKDIFLKIPALGRFNDSEEIRADAMLKVITHLDSKGAFNNNKAVFTNCGDGQNRANLANSSVAFYLLLKSQIEEKVQEGKTWHEAWKEIRRELKEDLGGGYSRMHFLLDAIRTYIGAHVIPQEKLRSLLHRTGGKIIAHLETPPQA